MRQSLPALNALRAFEAAARHASMAKAAAELFVSPSALSHQIRGLEAFLGVRLFERRGRQIELTVTGKALYPGLHLGFQHILDAVESLRAPEDEEVLVVSTPPAFAAKWLAPRLYRFAGAHPDFDVRLSSTMAKTAFAGDGIHCAVRNQPVDAPREDHLVYEPLIDIDYVAVCAPRLIPSGAQGDPRAFDAVPLIHDETIWTNAPLHGVGQGTAYTWRDFFDQAGHRRRETERGLRFSVADHALDAAVEGAGLLLTQAPLTFDDIRTGRLAVPFGARIKVGRAFFLVYPRDRAGMACLVAFRDWILGEIAETNCLMAAVLTS
ncbi:MAG: LysR family transcriptional regulator [Thalassobaculaceae bacterium]